MIFGVICLTLSPDFVNQVVMLFIFYSILVTKTNLNKNGQLNDNYEMMKIFFFVKLILQ